MAPSRYSSSRANALSKKLVAVMNYIYISWQCWCGIVLRWPLVLVPGDSLTLFRLPEIRLPILIHLKQRDRLQPGHARRREGLTCPFDSSPLLPPASFLPLVNASSKPSPACCKGMTTACFPVASIQLSDVFKGEK